MYSRFRTDPEIMLTEDKMQKTLRRVVTSAIEDNTWQKFANPSVGRGITAFPKRPADQQRLGVRYDYDGVITKEDGVEYHKFQMQANAGDDIPSTIKSWRDTMKGGTHAVMANVFVKKDATKEDVKEALEEAHKTVRGV